MKESPQERMYKKVMSKLNIKTQDPTEVFVTQYFGLTNPQSEQKILTTFADIVNLLAMFKESNPRPANSCEVKQIDKRYGSTQTRTRRKLAK